MHELEGAQNGVHIHLELRHVGPNGLHKVGKRATDQNETATSTVAPVTMTFMCMEGEGKHTGGVEPQKCGLKTAC